MMEDEPNLTPRMKRTLARANEIAQERGHDYVGTEHVLLAFLEELRSKGLISDEEYAAKRQKILDEL